MTWEARTRPPDHSRMEVFGMLCTTIDAARQAGELDTYDALEFLATAAFASGLQPTPSCELALLHLLRRPSPRSPVTAELVADIGADIYLSRWAHLEGAPA